MKEDEVLIRFFYVDEEFNKINRKEELPMEALKIELDRIKSEEKSLSREEIEKKLQDLDWVSRLKGLSCKKQEVDVNVLCIDTHHSGSLFHETTVKQGELHVDIVKKGEDAKTESLLKISDFKGFISNLPPAVRKRANFLKSCGEIIESSPL